ncbi:hypothetical protein INR49_029548 [Caranx melampygus]|nr:hypothetical protein INR49_029548 [Caranx melampygus]
MSSDVHIFQGPSRKEERNFPQRVLYITSTRKVRPDRTSPLEDVRSDDNQCPLRTLLCFEGEPEAYSSSLAKQQPLSADKRGEDGGATGCGVSREWEIPP